MLRMPIPVIGDGRYIMHSTEKPLTFWLKAMCWCTTRKSGVNAVNFHDLLGSGKRFWCITQQAVASSLVVCARPRYGCVPILPNHTT